MYHSNTRILGSQRFGVFASLFKDSAQLVIILARLSAASSERAPCSTSLGDPNQSTAQGDLRRSDPRPRSANAGGGVRHAARANQPREPLRFRRDPDVPRRALGSPRPRGCAVAGPGWAACHRLDGRGVFRSCAPSGLEGDCSMGQYSDGRSQWRLGMGTGEGD